MLAVITDREENGAPNICRPVWYQGRPLHYIELLNHAMENVRFLTFATATQSSHIGIAHLCSICL